MAEERDRWHRWLLDVRYGGDPAFREQMMSALYPVRDEVLDRAALQPDDTLLDVGTGDGLIAFGALERLGPGGRVIFSDVSRDLLDHCHAIAAEAGQLSRCDFAAFTAHLRPLVEAGLGEDRHAVTYLTARDGADGSAPDGAD